VPNTSSGVRVVVLRHGPAEVRDPARWPDDRLRPLSAKGARQSRRVARRLAHLLRPVSLLATSSATRARRTANIVGRTLDPPRRATVWPELDVGTLAAPILARVRREAGTHAEVVLVGHEPTLAELVGLALTGDGAPLLHLSKGGAACLEFPTVVRPGSARLLWLLTRKQLAGAAG
jgi:phosphohistidine phosphatase SixA